LNGYLDPDAESDETEASSESGLGKALLRLPTDRRCLVFVISDGLSRKPEDTEALEIAAAIHDVVFLVVGDMRERELPGKGFGFREIEDISSGQVVGIMLSDKTRKRWREGFDLDRRKLREHLENLGISMEEFFTHESSGHFAEKLLPILAGYRP
jgi:uncharacterized protein (DUF58 family)